MSASTTTQAQSTQIATSIGDQSVSVTTTSTSTIELRGVTKAYGHHVALRNIDLNIAQGEIVGLLGKNGAGKTTLLKLLCGLLLPSSGEVVVAGADATDDAMRLRRTIGYLPDRPPLYPEMAVEAFLRHVAQLRGMSAATARDAAAEAMERCGITHHASTPIAQLSHGYRQRVGIATAIVHRPPIVLLDEPISGLDPSQIVAMRGLIRALGGQHTVIVSSHILTELAATCDRFLVIDRGTVVADGTAAQISASVLQRCLLTVRQPPTLLERVLVTLAEVELHAIHPHGDAMTQAELTLHGATPRDALVRALVHAEIDVVALESMHGALESSFLALTGEVAS